MDVCIHWPLMSNKFTKQERDRQARDRRQKLSLVTLEEVTELFNYWILVLKSESARKPLMNDTRRQLLAIAIYDYRMDYCKQAIDGCSNSHYHMGRNKQGKVYNSIELIFRDNEHIERFAGYMDGGG